MDYNEKFFNKALSITGSFDGFQTDPGGVELYDRHARELMEAWGLTSMRAYCWAFDYFTHLGGPGGIPKPENISERTLRKAIEYNHINYTEWKRATMGEESQFLMVASYDRVRVAAPDLRQDAMARLGAISVGFGIVEGNFYEINFEETVDTDVPIDPDFDKYMDLVKFGNCYYPTEDFERLWAQKEFVRFPLPSGGVVEPSVNLNSKFLEVAAGELGVKEIPGPASNSRIEEYHRYAELDNDRTEPEEIPWCSSFVCYVAEALGLQSTNSRLARSWLNFGVEVEKPLPGDVIVFSRGTSSWKGHVGFFLRENPNGSFMVLSGNTRDEVNISQFGGKRVLGFRRAAEAGDYSQEEKQELWDYADDLIEGRLP